jgi:macrodomain Ter protein organizer (MatP/YcbG family)
VKTLRKLIDLDKEALETLKEEANRQNRSLKNLLEYILEEKSRKLQSPSAEYQEMMDVMLERSKNEKVDFSPIEEIEKKYGI